MVMKVIVIIFVYLNLYLSSNNKSQNQGVYPKQALLPNRNHCLSSQRKNIKKQNSKDESSIEEPRARDYYVDSCNYNENVGEYEKSYDGIREERKNLDSNKPLTGPKHATPIRPRIPTKPVIPTKPSSPPRPSKSTLQTNPASFQTRPKAPIKPSMRIDLESSMGNFKKQYNFDELDNNEAKNNFTDRNAGSVATFRNEHESNQLTSGRLNSSHHKLMEDLNSTFKNKKRPIPDEEEVRSVEYPNPPYKHEYSSETTINTSNTSLINIPKEQKLSTTNRCNITTIPKPVSRQPSVAIKKNSSNQSIKSLKYDYEEEQSEPCKNPKLKKSKSILSLNKKLKYASNLSLYKAKAGFDTVKEKSKDIWGSIKKFLGKSNGKEKISSGKNEQSSTDKRKNRMDDTLKTSKLSISWPIKKESDTLTRDKNQYSEVRKPFKRDVPVDNNNYGQDNNQLYNEKYDNDQHSLMDSNEQYNSENNQFDDYDSFSDDDQNTENNYHVEDSNVQNSYLSQSINPDLDNHSESDVQYNERYQAIDYRYEATNPDTNLPTPEPPVNSFLKEIQDRGKESMKNQSLKINASNKTDDVVPVVEQNDDNTPATTYEDDWEHNSNESDDASSDEEIQRLRDRKKMLEFLKTPLF